MLLRAVRAAAVAVLLSWGTLVVLCVVGWLSTPATTTPMSQAVGVGSLAWCLANLGGLSGGGAVVSLVPLALVAGPLLAVSRCVRTLREDVETDRSPRADTLGGMRRDTLSALGAFLGTYTLLGLVVAVVGTVTTPVHPSWLRTVAGIVVTGLVGTLVGLRRTLAREDVVPLWRDQAAVLLTPPVRRAAGLGLRATGALLLVGLLPVLVSLGLHAGRVRDIHVGLHAGVAGGVLLVLGQLLLLPNAAAWGLSWLAGPGFTVGVGSTFTWTRTSSVVLPNLPALGALPDPGTHSAWWSLTALLPVAVGAWTGSQALGTVTRLSSVRAKSLSVLVAVLSTAVLTLAVLALSGGALGTRALADIGPRSVLTATALLVELGIGAAAVLARSLWRFNRR